MAVPASAPSSVPMFQNTYTLPPVIQNAARWAAGSSCATAIAVDSSMVNCAATSRVPRRPGMRRPMVRPYTPLRAASTRAPPTADSADPPAPMTLTAENCDAPVNTSSDSAHVCATEAPALTAPTPNDTANTPTAAPSVTLASTTGRSTGSRHSSRALRIDYAPDGRSAASHSTPSGGTSTCTDAGRPCHGMAASAATVDPVPR